MHQTCVPNGGTVFCSSIDEHQRYRPQSWCNNHIWYKPSLLSSLPRYLSWSTVSTCWICFLLLLCGLRWSQQISVFTGFDWNVVVIGCKFGLSSGIILETVLRHQFVNIYPSTSSAVRQTAEKKIFCASFFCNDYFLRTSVLHICKPFKTCTVVGIRNSVKPFVHDICCSMVSNSWWWFLRSFPLHELRTVSFD
jgi:hypothetical protein